MIWTRTWAGVRWDAPLVPSPDQGGTLLRRELLRPEYHDQNLLQQFLHWLGRQFDSGINAASQAPPLSTAAVLALFLALLVLLGWLATRARRTPRARVEDGAVLTAEPVTAGELRARAIAALAAGNPAEAVIEAFRALALRQIERGWLDNQPGATAHEVAVSLGISFPDRRTRIDAAANTFDLVAYGDRPASVEQAEAVLALDDDLVGVR